MNCSHYPSQTTYDSFSNSRISWSKRSNPKYLSCRQESLYYSSKGTLAIAGRVSTGRRWDPVRRVFLAPPILCFGAGKLRGNALMRAKVYALPCYRLFHIFSLHQTYRVSEEQKNLPLKSCLATDYNVPVLVHSAITKCHSLVNSRYLFLSSGRLGSPRSRCEHRFVLVKSLLLVHSKGFLTPSSQGGRMWEFYASLLQGH